MRRSTGLPKCLFACFLRGQGLAAITAFACFCGVLSAAAQDRPVSGGAEAAASVVRPSDYSKEAFVYDKLYTRIRAEADGTGTRENTARIRILSDSGVKEMAVLVFTYTTSNQQVEIGYVRVIKPDGSIVVTPDYNVQDMPADVSRSAPMYSDIHQKHVTVKGLGVGDTLEYQVTLRTLKAEVAGQFWTEYSFEKNLVVLDEQLDLDLPAEKAVTVTAAPLQPSVTTVNGRKLYHWASSNLARPDPDAPPESKKHWKPSVQVTTFASWEQIGSWYETLQKSSLIVTPAIQAKADALTKGLTSNEDKLHAIFNDVALHIHYVGLEFGIGRYQPHAADDVLSNEYGDCKDKHTLLAALLKAAGIEAWPVLISSNRELDPKLPSPAQFNHAITLVSLGDKLIWMDSTEEVAPVGVLMLPLRNKQALAIPNGKPAYLERTPAELPYRQIASFQTEGTLSDQGTFAGHIVQTYRGDAELLLRTVFRQVPQSQMKVALQAFSNGIGFSGDISNPQVSEIEQTNQPIRFSYDYTREKYNQWNDHDTSHWISPPLPQMGMELAPGVKEKKPGDDPELGSSGESEYHATIKLPAGWTLVPPKDVDLKEDWLEYHAKYSFKDGVLTTDRTTIVKKGEVSLDDWEKYLAFRRGMFEDWNKTVLISPPGQAPVQTPEIHFMGIGATDQKLLDEMRATMQPLRDATAILQADPTPAPEELAKALALCRKTVEEFEAKSLTLPAEDAHSLGWARMLGNAWSTLGWAALESKDLPTAENYLGAAWHLNHNMTTGYLYGKLLEAKGNKAEAAHQYELASVANGGNSFVDGSYSSYNVWDRIRDAYRMLTGKPLNASALNHGGYSGSLRAQLDKETDFRGYTPTSKITGEALFIVSYEPGKPVKARFLQGDEVIASMAAVLERRGFNSNFQPSGSSARLLREVRVVCSEYGGGCDVYLLLPTALQIPATSAEIDKAFKNAKSVQIKSEQ